MDDGLPIVGPEVDLSQAPAINHKRTLAFLNHFITHTVRFLNRFSCVCEEKLAGMQVRIQRLEITLSILEAKLSSIPGLDQIAPVDTTQTTTATTTTNDTQQTQPTSNNTPTQNEEPAPVVVEEPEKPTMTVAKDSRYMKFFKMVSFGVPAAAVKGKMAAEGLNPDLLDTPNAAAPAGGGGGGAVQLVDDLDTSDDDDDDNDDNDDSSDASSFTDSD